MIKITRKKIIFIFLFLPLFAAAKDSSEDLSSALKVFDEGFYTKSYKLLGQIIGNDYVEDQILSTAKFYSAECLYRLEQLDGAASEYENFVDRYRYSNFRETAFYRLGDIYFRRLLFNKSRKRLLTLINEYPDFEQIGSAYYYIGEGYSRQGKLLDAEKFFLKAIDAKKTNSFIGESIYSLAALYEKRKEYENAIQYYSDLLAYHRDSNLTPQAQLHIGLCYFKQKEYDSAVLELSDPLINKLDKSFQYDAQYILAYSFFRLKDYKNAAKLFEELLKHDLSRRKNDKIKYSLAWVKFQMLKYDDAFKIFNKLSQTSSDTLAVKSLYWSAECKRYAGADSAAMDIYQKFIQKYPDNSLVAEVRFKMGLIHFNDKDIPVAERYLITSIDENDVAARGRSFTLLGEISLDKKDYRSAESYFSNAKKLDGIPLDLINRIKLGMGVSQYYLGKYNEAINNLNDLNSNAKYFEKDKVNFYLAEALFAKKDYSNSLRHFSRVGTSDKYLAKMALYGKAYSNFNLKDFPNAAYQFAEFISNYKNDKNIYDSKLRLAESYFGIKEFSKAAKVYNGIFSGRRKVNYDYAYYNYAQSLFKIGNAGKAISTLIELQNKFTRSKYIDDAQYLVGWIYFQQGDYGQAIENYEQLFIKYPSSPIRPIALYSIGDSYFNQAKYDSAIAYYNMLINNYGNTPFVFDAVSGIQYCYLAMDKPDSAVTVIDNYIESNSDSKFSDKILFKKGEIYYSQEKYEQAISGYQEFATRFPGSKLVPDAHYWIGKSALELEQTDKALENFKIVADSYINSEYGVAAVLEIGKIYSKRGQYTEAVELYDYAIKKLPRSAKVPELMYNKGLIQIQMEDLTSAYKTLNDVSQYFAESLFSDKSKIQLGLLELKRGGYENAELVFREVGKSRTDDIGAEAQYYYGVTLFDQDKIFDAITALVRVRSIFPGYIEWYTKSLLKLGDCYVKLNDKKQAREMYRAVLRKHKNNEYAKEASEKLKKL